eukprot:676541-Rhodomonas_salina.2
MSEYSPFTSTSGSPGTTAIPGTTRQYQSRVLVAEPGRGCIQYVCRSRPGRRYGTWDGAVRVVLAPGANVLEPRDCMSVFMYARNQRDLYVKVHIHVCLYVSMSVLRDSKVFTKARSGTRLLVPTNSTCVKEMSAMHMHHGTQRCGERYGYHVTLSDSKVTE